MSFEDEYSAGKSEAESSSSIPAGSGFTSGGSFWCHRFYSRCHQYKNLLSGQY